MNKIIYTVKLTVPKDIESDWIKYMKEHIGDILNTRCFDDFNVRKIIPEQSQEELSFDNNKSSIYLIEYESANRNALNRYFENHADALRIEYNKRFGSKTSASREIYEDQFHEWYEPINWDEIKQKRENPKPDATLK